MCSINGIFDYRGEAVAPAPEMASVMKHRGPDESGGFTQKHVTLGHNRLCVIDPSGGKQPMTRKYRGKRYCIVYNGEIYNTKELSAELRSLGVRPESASDTELVLWSYILFGEDCPRHLIGIFAFSVYDEEKDALFLARDHLGVKPLYYTEHGGRFYFASEVKGILKGSGMPAVLDESGIFQLLFLSPVTLRDSGVLRGIKQLLPGHAGWVTKKGLALFPYWQIRAERCEDSFDVASQKVRELMVNATVSQLGSDVPLATLLSGGLDSSVVSAISSRHLKEKGETLSTYSFTYEGNTYAPTLFQPNRDEDFAEVAAAAIGSRHTVLSASSAEVAAALPEAALFRDLPGQADIDSSLLYFCRRIKPHHTVLLSGECADEIFGGYPWFYRPEMLERDFFPWLHHPSLRASLFDPAFARPDRGLERLRALYSQTVSEAPLTGEEPPEDRQAKIATYLSVSYFMENLLTRKDRMSMATGLEVRVPFADYRILSYLYNVPWSVKFKGGCEKALLRGAMEGYLPHEILYRKKSPYPKTHNPEYEALVKKELEERLATGGPLSSLINKKRLSEVLEGEDRTWFGQLMGRPQLMGWLIQLDTWLRHYSVSVV